MDPVSCVAAWLAAGVVSLSSFTVADHWSDGSVTYKGTKGPCDGVSQEVRLSGRTPDDPGMCIVDNVFAELGGGGSYVLVEAQAFCKERVAR